MAKLTPSEKTKRDRESARKAKQREKLKAQRERRKTREAERKAKRKAKREAKAAPKNKLAAWSAEVRKDGRCMVCGATEYLNAHHVLPKERYPEYRFEPKNGVCLCPTHHKFGTYSAHRSPIWFALWLRINRPEQYQWCESHLGADAPGVWPAAAGETGPSVKYNVGESPQN